MAANLLTIAILLPYYVLIGGLIDLFLLACVAALRNWNFILQTVDNIESSLLIHAVSLARALLGCILAVQIVRFFWTSGSELKWAGPGKPLLFPSKTAHARIFPKTHSFSYSYLVVGVPVGWEGNAGDMVSSGHIARRSWLDFWLSWFSLTSRQKKAWYHVDPADHLYRGNATLGLHGKLTQYLESRGVDASTYPFAYLITAATFMGYQFNPVSFWYLYSSDKTLAAMILEVNNTFDERRMYFLTPSKSDAQLADGPTADAVPDDTKQSPGSVKFKQRWPKDFHVSPFNSRKGYYSLVATDPLSPEMRGPGSLNNTINLKSSKDHAKLVARLFSSGAPIDPSCMGARQKLKFLGQWWWVGFVTFPRIVREAGALWFKRRLHVWYRPEPLKETIGRNADETERRLESVFRGYLRHLVRHAAAPLSVRYVPSGLADGAAELMLSPAASAAVVATRSTTQSGTASTGGDAPPELELRVLTPAFYARFVSYAHDFEAFFDEWNDSATLWLSQPELLPRLVVKATPSSQALHISSPRDFLEFKLIQRLRRRPARIVRPLTSADDAAALLSAESSNSSSGAALDVRAFRMSPMDAYILTHSDAATRKAYRRDVLALFVAERIALGNAALLALERSALRAGVAWMLCHALSQALVDPIGRLSGVARQLGLV